MVPMTPQESTSPIPTVNIRNGMGKIYAVSVEEHEGHHQDIGDNGRKGHQEFVLSQQPGNHSPRQGGKASAENIHGNGAAKEVADQASRKQAGMAAGVK